MTQTHTPAPTGTPLWLLPPVGLLAGAAHTAGWHFIPIPTVTLAITFGAMLILWIVASSAAGSKGGGVVMALIMGLCALGASWALWLVLVFGLDGLQETVSFGGVGAVMDWIAIYLDQFSATVSRRSQSMSFNGEEIRVMWMVMAAIWIVLPLVAAAIRKT